MDEKEIKAVYEDRQLNGYPLGDLECAYCGKLDGHLNRQLTLYDNDEANWGVYCPTCQRDMDADYWLGQWDELNCARRST
jgi:hypothetical protein